MNKVNLFIVGAAKCGTTSLHSYLDEHPQICMSSVKEPNFFTWDFIEKQGLYYKGETYVKTDTGYDELFKCEGESEVFGEASVSYLFYKGTAARIKAYNPEARIIILLRDPSKRAYSHYLMDKRLGFMKEDIMTIFNNPDKFPLHYQQVFTLGLYADQIKEYLDAFGKDKVLIILSNDLNGERQKVLNQVFQFVGVSSYETSATDRELNTAGKGNNALIRLLYQFRSVRKALAFILPQGLKERMKRILFRKKPDKITEAEYKLFREYYRNDILKLEDFTGLDLRDWRE